MNERPHLTMRYFLRVVLVFGVFPLIFYAVAAAFCFGVASYLLSHQLLDSDNTVAKNIILLLFVLPLSIGNLAGWFLGLKISSRIFTREEMYEILVGLHPTPRSIKSANRTLNRLYPN